MSDGLTIYLHDHLAGATHAIDLVETIRDQHITEPLGEFAAALLSEIETDRQVLQRLADRAGAPSSGIKEATAWLAEKVTRLKIGGGSADALETFEALEFLMLGIQGKWAMWRALGAAAANDVRLQGMNFEQLAQRAELQRDQVEERRLEAALKALPLSANL